MINVHKNLTLLPYHHPLLKDRATTVEFPLPPEDSQLINDMLYSVEEPQLAAAGAPWPSAAGMAAPQWGASRRIFVIQRQYLKTSKHFLKVEQHLRGSDRFVVIINPKYTAISQKTYIENEDSEGCHILLTGNTEIQGNNEALNNLEEIVNMEGCFSVPGKRGLVKRYKFIKAEFSLLDGTTFSLMLSGWPARVFQHETDHTEGILYDDSDANKCVKIFGQ